MKTRGEIIGKEFCLVSTVSAHETARRCSLYFLYATSRQTATRLWEWIFCGNLLELFELVHEQ